MAFVQQGHASLLGIRNFNPKHVGNQKLSSSIHAFIESLDTNTWQWECSPTGKQDIKQDYELFGFLAAGVRSAPTEHSFAQRGFPNPASLEVQANYAHWSKHAHSASWLTLSDLRAQLGQMIIIPPKSPTLIPLVQNFLRIFPEHLGNPNHCRAVFWFDN